MQLLDDILQGDRKLGLYRLTTEINLDSLSLALQEHGWKLFYLEGTQITNKLEFLQACASVMDFPSYFGSNWDAFEECVTDPGIVSSKRSILLYNQPEFFAQNDPSQWSTAVQILQTAVDYWSEKNTLLYVLFKTNSSLLNELEALHSNPI
jgi:RNAse (barnase) inhibitor barstar